MILSMVILEEEYNITIDKYIICVIYIDMPRSRLVNKKYGVSKPELAAEPTPDFSSNKIGDELVVEEEVVELINYNTNDEYEGNMRVPHQIRVEKE